MIEESGDDLPEAQGLLADCSYAVRWFGNTLEQWNIKPCVRAANASNSHDQLMQNLIGKSDDANSRDMSCIRFG